MENNNITQLYMLLLIAEDSIIKAREAGHVVLQKDENTRIISIFKYKNKLKMNLLGAIAWNLLLNKKCNRSYIKNIEELEPHQFEVLTEIHDAVMFGYYYNQEFVNKEIELAINIHNGIID